MPETKMKQFAGNEWCGRAFLCLPVRKQDGGISDFRFAILDLSPALRANDGNAFALDKQNHCSRSEPLENPKSAIQNPK
jgi:hypothetical protein